MIEIYIYIYIIYKFIYRRLGGKVNREIVSFRSCVRASEAACAREAMLLPLAREILGHSCSCPRGACPPLAMSCDVRLLETTF